MDAPVKKSFPFTGGFGKKPLEEKIETLMTVNAGLEKRLRDEKQRLEQYKQHSEDRQQDYERISSKLREENSTQATEIRHLKEKLPALKVENERLEAEVEALTDELGGIRQVTLASTQEVEVLSDANRKMEQKLSEQAEKILELGEENECLEERRIYLENVIGWFNQRYEQLNSGAFDEHEVQKKAELEIMQKLEAAEALTVELRNRVEALEVEKEELIEQSSVKMNDLEGQRQSLVMELKHETERLKAENEGLAADLGSQIDELETARNRFEHEISDMQAHESILRKNTPQTLRSLLILRYIETRFPTTTSDDAEPAEPNRSWPALPQDDLDRVYTPREFDRVTEILRPGTHLRRFYKQLRLKTCSICSKPKIRSAFTHTSLTWLNEFPAQGSSFNCCDSKVCRKCFVDYLIETVQQGWWQKPGSLQWIPCPRPTCDSPLLIRCLANFQLSLERNKAPNVEEHMKTYEKALILRQALQEMSEVPSDEALSLAADLHKHLIKSDRMYNFFDSRFEPTGVDETGCLPDFDPGPIMRADIANVPFKVPLFLRFFRRQTTAKTCILCIKSKFDIDYENLDTWNTVCENFKGRWMWEVLAYPTAEIQQCDHDFDVCRSCTSEHISSMLESEGPGACDKLSCPQCDRRLSYLEITRLTDTKTVEKYDHFLLQNTLSKEPNFRWCLRPTCTNGQLYNLPPRDHKIECEECHFEMCFTDQAPWHEGFSCSEWQSQREHGDPNHKQTEDWLSENSKACPGCSRRISKDGGCFHMTCQYCSHQFCWECLADYAVVRRDGQEGHGAGCYFREHDTNPMHVRGSTLNEALGNTDD